jgi:hypothetical protein
MPASLPPVTKTITLAEGTDAEGSGGQARSAREDLRAKLLMKRLMLTINSALDTDTATTDRPRVRRRRADAQLRRGVAAGG